MNIQVLNRVVDELKSETIRGIISNIHQMDERHIILKIFSKGKEKSLLISTHPRFYRLHLTEKKYGNPPSPLRFCVYLRSHIKNHRIEDIKTVPGERVVHILFKDLTLIVELAGRDSNIILIDKDGVVLDALRYFPAEKGCPRPVKPGLVYTPPKATKHSDGISISKENLKSYNTAMDEYYSALTKEDEFLREKAGIVRVIADNKKRLKRKLENLFDDRKKAEADINLSRHGELLAANFSKIKKGMREVEVVDYYTDTHKTTTIPIDPMLLPQENIDRFFKRARKAKTAIEFLKERIPSTEDEIRYLEEALFHVDEAEDIEDIYSTKEALIHAGYTRTMGRLKKERARIEPLRRFKSTEGHEILCGKTASGNDLILKRYARDYDLWFHAYTTAGSHVLLRLKNKDEEPSRNSILEAGVVAVFFSKARGEAKAEVAYTPVKNVKKPKGAKPGMVAIKNFKTIIVKPDEEVVKRLMRHDV